MRNVLYDFDPKTSLFEHRLTTESTSSEIDYILSVSQMLETLEYKRPKLFLVETNDFDIESTNKLACWITSHVLPQIARIGVRKMAIVGPSLSFDSTNSDTLQIFPWLKVATFPTVESAKRWLLSPNSSRIKNNK